MGPDYPVPAPTNGVRRASRHNRAAFLLGIALERQLPAGFECITDVDVDLRLAPPDAPGTVRRPDMIVVASGAPLRVEREGGVLRASDVLVVVEVVAPGSTRTDHVHKRGEYADAGIPHYWILDPTEPISLLACHLAGEFGYADGATVTGRFTATEPFPLGIDLDSLG